MIIAETETNVNVREFVLATPPELTIDIRFDGSRWQWVKHYADGRLNGFSSETFATAQEAAEAAYRIADAYDAPVSNRVLQASGELRRRWRTVGYEFRLFGRSLDECWNDDMRLGWYERMSEESAEASIEAADQEQDEEWYFDEDGYAVVYNAYGDAVEGI